MRTSLDGFSKRVYVLGLSIVVVAAIALVAVGCGLGDDVGDGGTVSTTTTSASTVTTDSTTTTVTAPTDTTTTTAAANTMKVRVYFSQNEKICAATRLVPKTQEVGAASMKALLEGPTDVEKDAGMVSSIPEGTTFLGLDIQDGVATVEFSKEYESGGGSLSMFMRLAEVVFTLTQFPSVDGVRFKLDGEPIEVLGGEGIIIDHPMTREDFEDMSPAILVESVTVGDAISSPVRVTGTANVFEAVFRINIVNWDGLIIADEIVMATSGTGTRGTFDVTIPFTVDREGLGALIVFADSPQDGSPINVIEIPVQIQR